MSKMIASDIPNGCFQIPVAIFDGFLIQRACHNFTPFCTSIKT